MKEASWRTLLLAIFLTCLFLGIPSQVLCPIQIYRIFNPASPGVPLLYSLGPFTSTKTDWNNPTFERNPDLSRNALL